jgi:hypothetical protein
MPARHPLVFIVISAPDDGPLPMPASAQSAPVRCCKILRKIDGVCKPRVIRRRGRVTDLHKTLATICLYYLYQNTDCCFQVYLFAAPQLTMKTNAK